MTTQSKHKNKVKKVLTGRKFIFIALLLTLILLCSYYESNYQQHLENPNTATIIENYPIGQTVAVAGSVLNVQSDSFTILDEYHSTDVTYTILSTEKPSVGDEVEVLGVLGDSNTVVASKILVITNFDYDLMLLRSAIALLIFLFFFRRYWRFDFKKFEFRRLK
jgi:cytochrome c-type biogenesis protein CcmE